MAVTEIDQMPEYACSNSKFLSNAIEIKYSKLNLSITSITFGRHETTWSQS